MTLAQPSGNKILLVVSAWPVWPYRDGFTLRTIEVLQELNRDWDFVIVAPVHKGESSETEPFRVLGREVPPLQPGTEWFPATSQEELTRHVRTALSRFSPNAVLCWGYSNIPRDVRRALPPIVYDMIDCGCLTEFRTILRGRTWRERWWALQVLKHSVHKDRAIVRNNAMTITVGEKDAAVLRAISRRAEKIRIISNGVRAQAVRTEQELSSEPTMTFSGVLHFPPNVDAALHFADEVFPRVQREFPDAKFILAGRGPVEPILKLAERPGISVLADVPDMFAVLRRSWVCVAPMRSGAGVKNKILEAWAVGTPVVMSEMAANGIALDDRFSNLICRSATALAERTIALLKDKRALMQLGAELHAVATERHSWKTVAAQFDELLSSFSIQR